jgi:hypothetical protein
MPITHTFVSAKSDGGDATLVRPSDWNASHTVELAGTLLALKVYAPSSQTIYSTSSSTLADVDATNFAVTFTAPASGNVIVRASAWIDQSAGTGGDFFMGLREGSTDLACVTRVARDSTDHDSQQYLSVPLYLSGLGAGSHTLKLSFAASSSNTYRIIVQDGSVATTKWGPFVMEVIAAP